VPNTSAGEHTLSVNDGVSNFCINITRLPIVANDYDGLWHANNVTINLMPDYSVTEIYYMINSGPVENVSANGQPVITAEGSNNTLEYWSTWDVYGTGLMDLPPVFLTGIEVQSTPPQGSMLINGGATSTSSNAVTLTISATDPLSGISQIRFSNDGTWTQSTWEPYANTVSWQLTSGDGTKTVYCQIEDNAGLTTAVSSSIILSTPQPAINPSPLTSTATPTPNPSSASVPSPTPNPTTAQSPAPTPNISVTPRTSANVISTPTPSISPTHEPLSALQSPEVSIGLGLALLALLTILFANYSKRKAHIKQ
jgi:hypothetical protein